MIQNFNDLLTASKQQSQPQRLIMMFVRAESETNTSGGLLEPLMCVDKLPEEIEDFSALVTEADSINDKWDFVFTASLSGSEDAAPSSEEAEPYLNSMVSDLKTGQSISRYAIFDRKQNPVSLSVN